MKNPVNGYLQVLSAFAGIDIPHHHQSAFFPVDHIDPQTQLDPEEVSIPAPGMPFEQLGTVHPGAAHPAQETAQGVGWNPGADLFHTQGAGFGLGIPVKLREDLIDIQNFGSLHILNHDGIGGRVKNSPVTLLTEL